MIKHTTKKHYDKYAKLVEEIGLKLPSNFMELDRAKWVHKFMFDENLNNVPLWLWDGAGYNLIHKKGLSMAEKVCILKHAVIYQIIGATPEFEED